MITKAIHPAAMAYAASQNLGSVGANGGDFASLLEKSLNNVSASGARAERLSEAVAAGQRPEVVDVVTAVAESEAALETLVAVRDKVVQAYEDIMRMPI